MDNENAALPYQYNPSLRLLAVAVFYLARFQKKYIFHNLDFIFRDALNKSQKRRFTLEYLQHLAKTGFETLSLIFQPAKIRPVQVNLSETFVKALMRNEGAVIAAAHLGHWEISLLHGLAKDPHLKNRLVVIRKSQKGWVNMLIPRIYADSGVDIIQQKGSLLKGVRALKQGKVLVIACDSL